MNYEDFCEIVDISNDALEYGGVRTGWAEEFRVHLRLMIEMLDNADADDVFGTQGWKYQVGLED